MKKARLLTLILAVLLVVCMLPASIFATEGTYTIDGDINSFMDLAPYLDYDTIEINGGIKSNSWAEIIELGKSTTVLPTIVSKYTEYPIRILPAYDGTNFEASKNVKTTAGHSITQDAHWQGSVLYVYAKSTDSNKDDHPITIDHGVIDASATPKNMLQYASQVSWRYEGETLRNALAQKNADNILKYTLTPADIKTLELYVLYQNVLAAWTESGSGSDFARSRSYTYHIAASYLSTVATDIDYQVLGNIKIVKENKSGAALKNAVFNVFSDKDCLVAAKAFDAKTQTWTEIGDVTTGDDGTVTVSNLAPGTYYVKEKTAPEGYVLDTTAKAVEVKAPAALNVGIDTASGEGSSATVDGNTVAFTPIWNDYSAKANKRNTLSMTKAGGSTKAASDFGGEVFIKGKGSSVAFAAPADVAKLDAMTKLSTGKYDVNVYGKSAPNNSYDKLADALAYVNTTLIADGGIDDAALGQNHVTIKNNNTIYYADSVDNAAAVTFVNEAVPVDVTVNKSWFNSTKPQPGEVVTVQLYQDGKAFGEAVNLDENNKWTYTWKQLEGGHKYTVDETAMPEDCVLESITNDGDVWTILNRRVMSVTVNKSWFNDTKPQRPETLDVQLYKDGKAVGEPIVLKAENDWTYTWENVDYGKYTVKEVEVPAGYKVSYESKDNILTIKNTYVKQSPKTGDNTALIAAAAITVTVCAVYVAIKLRKEQ